MHKAPSEKAKLPKGIVFRNGGYVATIQHPPTPEQKARGERGKREWLTFDANGQRFTSKRAAELARAARLTEIATGNVVRFEKITVAELLARWMEGQDKRFSPSTVRGRRNWINSAIVPRIGAIPARDLAPAHITAFYGELLASGRRDRTKDGRHRAPRGLSETSAHNIHLVLSAAFKWAVRMEIIARNPLDKLSPRDKPQAKSKGKRNAFTEDEIARVLDAVRGTRFSIAFDLALDAGLRRGEVAALRWDAVDFEKRELRIFRNRIQVDDAIFDKGPKGGRERTVPMTPRLHDALKARSAQYAAEKLRYGKAFDATGYVVADELGRPEHPDHITGHFRRLAASLGIKKCFHELRHTLATQLIMSGVDVVTVSYIVGHAKVSTTLDIYGHLIPGQKRSAMEALDTTRRSEAV
jgi:integrase